VRVVGREKYPADAVRTCAAERRGAKKNIRSLSDDMMLAQPHVIYTGLIVTFSAGAAAVEEGNRFVSVSDVQFTQIDELHVIPSVSLSSLSCVYSGISLHKACVNLGSHSGSNIVW